ncbi:DDE-type integrase/transposase/recombinase [Poseidonocella sp. HB161398]|uniref:DDE-type integrase/transposase/recombinase n=1 Tax=Poseidonocella sp. HB161398 TaxID=2320855 RepID=UPI001108EC22|nr:DDE-type integrase/transposase/recombinase [Poseidonocella sp. HB161398]
MTSAPDRRKIAGLIDDAMAAGARRAAASAELGLHPHTLARWHDPQGGIGEDQRPMAPRPVPANKHSDEERARIIATCARPEFASLPPGQIVPMLADSGTYIASESSFYRVLREHGQNHRRGRARAPVRRKAPTSFGAKGPCQVWTWDITWLPGPVAGRFFYLYIITDIWSRKITGWEVHERETSENAAALLQRAAWAEKCVANPLVFHTDNGSPLSGIAGHCRAMPCRAAYESKRCSRLTGSQVDGLKFHGRSSSIRFFGCPAAIASSVALR